MGKRAKIIQYKNPDIIVRNLAVYNYYYSEQTLVELGFDNPEIDYDVILNELGTLFF
jgi:hypothetical protein